MPQPAQKFFVPPSFGEVTAYCKERCNQVNPVKFLAHYETRDLIAGKKIHSTLDKTCLAQTAYMAAKGNKLFLKNFAFMYRISARRLVSSPPHPIHRTPG